METNKNPKLPGNAVELAKPPFRKMTITFALLFMSFIIVQRSNAQSRIVFKDFSTEQKKSADSTGSKPNYVVRRLSISDKIDAAIKQGKLQAIRIEASKTMTPKEKAMLDSIALARANSSKEPEVRLVLESEVKRWSKEESE